MKIIIKQVREKLNISLEELEDNTGINRKRLSQLENNEIDIEKILFIEMFLIADSLRETHRRFVCKWNNWATTDVAFLMQKTQSRSFDKKWLS